MIRNNIVTYAGTLGGVLLVLIGLLGFCFPNFLGVHLSPMLNLVHLATGALAVYFGLKSTSLGAGRTFCMAIGVLYSLLGLSGFVVGGLGNTLVYLTLGAGFVAAAILQPLPSNTHSRSYAAVLKPDR